MFKTLILPFLLLPALASAQALSLSEVLGQARAQAPGAQAALADADAALHGSWAGFAWPDPQFAFEWMNFKGGDPRLSDAKATRMELSQALPFPGRTFLMGLAGRRAAQARAAEAAAMQAEAVMRAESAWWRVQEARLGLRGLEQGLKSMEALGKVSQRRGRFGRLDRMGQVMDAMLARDQARLAAMRRSLEQDAREAELDLAASLGKPEAAGLSLAAADLDALADEARDTALKRRARQSSPALRAAEAKAAAAGLELASAASAWLPDLMLMGAVEAPTNMPQMREASFRIAFSLPFVWAWGQTGKTLAARDERRAALAGLEQARAEAQAKAEAAASRLKSSQAALQGLRDGALAPAQKAMELAVAGYGSGDVGASEAMAAVMGYVDTYRELAMQAGRTGMARAELRRLAGPSEDSHEE